MRFTTWGLSGTLATEHPGAMDYATSRLWHWINEIDRACNRFRPSSELARLNERTGEPIAISPTLERAVRAALDAAAATDGLCTPTVLGALLAWGYDRDFDEIRVRDVWARPIATLTPPYTDVAFDADTHTIRLAPGCRLDLGASAKALVADVVADEVAERGGVVVEVGGDVAVRGSGPDGPWVIGTSASLRIRGNEPRVAVAGGGVATSSLTARTWRVDGREVSHIIDPRTGAPAQGPYATATVAAASCVTANAFATAALLWGENASYHIAQAGWSARLVRRDGTVDYVGGWPAETPT